MPDCARSCVCARTRHMRAGPAWCAAAPARVRRARGPGAGVKRAVAQGLAAAWADHDNVQRGPLAGRQTPPAGRGIARAINSPVPQAGGGHN